MRFKVFPFKFEGNKILFTVTHFFFFYLGIKQDHEFPPPGHSLKGKAA